MRLSSSAEKGGDHAQRKVTPAAHAAGSAPKRVYARGLLLAS